jgi:hypothetical protein
MAIAATVAIYQLKTPRAIIISPEGNWLLESTELGATSQQSCWRAHEPRRLLWRLPCVDHESAGQDTKNRIRLAGLFLLDLSQVKLFRPRK